MSESEQEQQLTVFGDGRDINEDNEEIPEWARPYIRTLKLQVNSLQAELKTAKHSINEYALSAYKWMRCCDDAKAQLAAAERERDQMANELESGQAFIDIKTQLAAANERAESLAANYDSAIDQATVFEVRLTQAEAEIALLRPKAALGERYHRLLKAGGAKHFHDGGIEACDSDCPELIRRRLDEQWDTLHAAPVQAVIRKFEGQDDWPCICGHAKCLPGESHFFGDPRPTEPSTPWCMVQGCGCKQFRPALEPAAARQP